MEVEMSSLRDQLSNLEAMNRKIRRNFSSLLKTARAEIARKDKSIADLRTEYAFSHQKIMTKISVTGVFFYLF